MKRQLFFRAMVCTLLTSVLMNTYSNHLLNLYDIVIDNPQPGYIQTKVPENQNGTVIDIKMIPGNEWTQIDFIIPEEFRLSVYSVRMKIELISHEKPLYGVSIGLITGSGREMIGGDYIHTRLAPGKTLNAVFDKKKDFTGQPLSKIKIMTKQMTTPLELRISGIELITEHIPDTGNSEENISRGKPYVYNVFADYPYCMDEGDKTDLTDGAFANPNESLWTDKKTAGWRMSDSIVITIDLLKTFQIDGVSVNTSAGRAGVLWPSAVHILASDDNINYYYITDLVKSTGKVIPSDDESKVFNFYTGGLNSFGRYVRVIVKPRGEMKFFFCDEIEVFGSAGRSKKRDKNAVPAGLSWYQSHGANPFLKSAGTEQDKIGAGIKFRLLLDIEEINNRITGSALNPADKNALGKILSVYSGQIDSSIDEFFKACDIKNFKAIIPLIPLHEKILSVFGQLLKKNGSQPLTVWHIHRYAPLTMFQNAVKEIHSLSINMLQNETRSEVMVIQTSGDTPQDIRINVKDLQGMPLFTEAEIFTVEYFDTKGAAVIADPLIPLKKTGYLYSLRIIPGINKQLFLKFNSANTATGIYSGYIEISVGTHIKKIKITVQVHSVSVPAVKTLAFGVWDYSDVCIYDLNTNNRHKAVSDMRAHLVNVPCGHKDTYPYPLSNTVDKSGNIIKPIDFSKFDAWIKLWPSAKHYMMMDHSVKRDTDFAGHARGTPEFDKAVSQWATAWASHNRSLGIKPGQIVLNLVDEPWTDTHFAIIRDWAQAIKKGTSDILIYANRINDTKSAGEARPFVDIINPGFVEGPEMSDITDYKEAITILKKMNTQKLFWFYSCSGPTRFFDPTGYFRAQPWMAFLCGAEGSFFWSYADGSGNGGSYNEYTAKDGSFTPVYIADNVINSSKHWEAAMEGVLDFEYLVLLNKMLRSIPKNIPLLKSAVKLRDELPGKVFQKYWKSDLRTDWFKERDYNEIDEYRLELIKMLNELSLIR